MKPTRFLILIALALSLPVSAETWVERSDKNAQVLIDILAKQSPEGAGQLGVPGFDEEIFDLKPGFVERSRAEIKTGGDTLRQRLASEKDPKVRQDLEILIAATEDQLEGSQLGEKYTLPYFDLSSTIFQGIRTLLDDQVEASRRPAALVRLRKYTGVEPGYTPIGVLAEQFIRSRMSQPGLMPPFKDEVEKDLQNTETYLKGIEELFKKYNIQGYEQPYAKLREQAAAYEAFVRKEILPKARTDFRQPAELYAYNLKTLGVDMPVEQLVSRAKVGFREIQNEMQALAQLVAKERGYSFTDYRQVLAELKKTQVTGEAILPLYQQRIQDMERIIREQKIVSLPERPMKVRLASEAESAATPAPNMRPPRLLGNTGEMGEFVLPLRIPGKGDAKLELDDFTYDALSWALTAHEGRPGHELQFASLVEKGVSRARIIFSFNSVNVEGWALYAEAEVKPYMPLEAQLAALQSRLMRAARAFLDPGLQSGQVTRDEAMRVLREEVGLSEGMALQEVERYTFRSPGQATSYFCGYTRLMELRTDAERALGPKFDRLKYHDFILAQGLLPPSLLRKAVMEEFVPAQ
ncbi:MAG TPA: DUF885 domain-containing protein [Thermoanaerobaculia bacterium]|nr:DUF885 domain-containing protein [Thermoanaerobaculia bacterium]